MKDLELLIDNRQDIEVGKDLEEKLVKAIIETLKYEGQDLDVEVSLSFVDNLEIKGLNKTYRGIDRETDVLSFPSGQEWLEMDSSMPKILGDIVISIEKAAEQAKEYGHSLERELVYLTVHSSLHLLGYDHILGEDKKIMRSREKDIMEILGVFK